MPVGGIPNKISSYTEVKTCYECLRNFAFKEKRENHYKHKPLKLSLVSLSPSFQSLEKRRRNIADSTCWYSTGASCNHSKYVYFVGQGSREGTGLGV